MAISWLCVSIHIGVIRKKFTFVEVFCKKQNAIQIRCKSINDLPSGEKTVRKHVRCDFTLLTSFALYLLPMRVLSEGQAR